MDYVKKDNEYRLDLTSEKVKNIISDAILTGQLKPGDRVVETQWAKKIGVSQSPVREAMKELEAKGLIEIRPYKGALVKRIKKTDMIDAYCNRIALQMLAFYYAIEMITEEQTQQLEAQLIEMREDLLSGNSDAFIENAYQLLRTFLSISQNELLIKIWEQCKFREYTKITVANTDNYLEEVFNRYSTVLAALKKKDLDAGKKIAEECLQSPQFGIGASIELNREKTI